MSYVYSTLVARFGTLLDMQTYLPWIGKIGQGLNGGVYDVYVHDDMPATVNDLVVVIVVGAHTYACRHQPNGLACVGGPQVVSAGGIVGLVGMPTRVHCSKHVSSLSSCATAAGRYLSSTEHFATPGIANDTASYTVICALKHEESFHLILLWSYKATLIGVGIIFLNLIFSRVIVKGIVAAFEQLRRRTGAGQLNKRRFTTGEQDADSAFAAADGNAVEMTQSAAERMGMTSPSKRPKAAGLADFL